MNFNKFPPRISSIAYDAVLAISKISQNKNDAKIIFSDFTDFNNDNKNGFDGIDGVFRFLPNGAVQRNLAVLQVGNGKFETLDSSIRKFLKCSCFIVNIFITIIEINLIKINFIEPN
jgi:hypothetical protein